MLLNNKFQLSNGVEIPKIGLGTWEIKDEVSAQAVLEAIKLGYRHIDSAQAYGNERGIGEGIRNSGLKRDEIFVTTKIDASVKTYQEAITSIEGSLERFDFEYLDLMLIHSPKPWMEFLNEEPYFEGNREVWRAFEDLYKAGKLRAIGVSNFEQVDLENIFETCTIKPMVNQILTHISNVPFDLIEYSQKQGVLVEAYSPIAHGELMKNKEVLAIAQKYNVSIPQLSIRFCLQLGLLPLPKTANPAHMKANSEVDFEISTADMEILKGIEQIKDYGEFSKFPVFGKKL